MSVLEAAREPQPAELVTAGEVGPLGRLGGWTVDHVRTVALAWIVAAIALGAFAPRAEHALSGAGWEASGSESVQARRLVQESFGGLSSQAFMVAVHSETQSTADPGFRQVLASVTARLRASNAVATRFTAMPASASASTIPPRTSGGSSSRRTAV